MRDILFGIILLGTLGFGVFTIYRFIKSLFKGQVKHAFKKFSKRFLIIVGGLILAIIVVPKNEPTKTEENAVEQKVENKKTETEAKQKAEAEKKIKEENQKDEQLAEAKKNEEAKIKADKLVVDVHLDDVKDIPKYSIETYKKGDQIPAADGGFINCTYPNCYKIVFDVDGSGQNPTEEYNSLRNKLENRNILDKSYDGEELPTINAEYWTKNGMITARFYK